MEEEISDIILFFGRFHPIFLHLPIGFLFIAFALEVLSRFAKFSQYKPAVGLILLLGAASAVAAAGLGYMLAHEGGYDEQLLSVHQWTGIAVSVLSVAAYLLRHRSRQRPTVLLDRAYMTVFSAVAVALLVTGHYGGSLTHGSGYLIQYMPNSLRTLAGLPAKEQKGFKKITNLEEAVVFTDIIFPIIETRCNSCHNESKSKGELQMHTAEALLKGGENGAVLHAGNAEESEMLKRVYLPLTHDDHMPPKGKSQLTDEQVKLLAWWINEGSPFDKTVAQVNIDGETQAILNTLIDPEANKTVVEKLLSSQIAPADEQILGQLQHAGVLVSTLVEEEHWLQANIPHNLSGDSLVHTLNKVSEQLTWLDLGGSGITDEGLTVIGNLKNLTRLYLDNTQITDEGLQHLDELIYLEYLNLYGTQVSDEGIQQLSGLKNLKRLYLWQTKVTKEGAAQLQKSLPDLEINRGSSLP